MERTNQFRCTLLVSVLAMTRGGAMGDEPATNAAPRAKTSRPAAKVETSSTAIRRVTYYQTRPNPPLPGAPAVPAAVQPGQAGAPAVPAAVQPGQAGTTAPPRTPVSTPDSVASRLPSTAANPFANLPSNAANTASTATRQALSRPVIMLGDVLPDSGVSIAQAPGTVPLPPVTPPIPPPNTPPFRLSRRNRRLIVPSRGEAHSSIRRSAVSRSPTIKVPSRRTASSSPSTNSATSMPR